MPTFGVCQVDDLLQMESVESGVNAQVHVVTMIADISWEDFKAVLSASYDIAELTVTYSDDEGDRIPINSAEEFKALVQFARRTDGSPLQLVLQPGDVSCAVLLQFPDLLQVRPAATSLQSSQSQSSSAKPAASSCAQNDHTEVTAHVHSTLGVPAEALAATAHQSILGQRSPEEEAALSPVSSPEAPEMHCATKESPESAAEVTSDQLCEEREQSSKEEQKRDRKRSWSTSIEDMIRHMSKDLSKVKRATKRREQPEPPAWFTAYMDKFAEQMTQEVPREAARRTIKQIFKAKPKLQERGEPLPEVLQMAPVAVEVPTSSAAGAPLGLDARFIRDGSFPDGSSVMSEAVIPKHWSVLNCGQTAWPDNTKLVHLFGDLTPETPEVSVGGLARGAVKHVLVYLTAPAREGRAQSHWCLQTGSSVFGDRLWCNVLVSAQPLAVDQCTQTSTEVCTELRSRTYSGGGSSDSDFVVLPSPHVLSLSGLCDSEDDRPAPELVRSLSQQLQQLSIDRDVASSNGSDSFLRLFDDEVLIEAPFTEEVREDHCAENKELYLDEPCTLVEETVQETAQLRVPSDREVADEPEEPLVELCLEVVRAEEPRADVLESTYHSLPGTPRASPLLSPGTPLSRHSSLHSLSSPELDHPPAPLAEQAHQKALAAHREMHERIARETQQQLQEALTQLERCSVNYAEVDRKSSFEVSSHVGDAASQAVAAAQQALSEAYGRAQQVIDELRLPSTEQSEEEEGCEKGEHKSEDNEERTGADSEMQGMNADGQEDTIEEQGVDEDKATEKHEADGGSAQHEADGGSAQHEADGSSAHHEADGGSAYHEADGGSAHHEADGGSAHHEADGGSAHHEADGGSAQHEADGGSAQHLPANHPSWKQSEPWCKPNSTWTPSPAWLPKTEAWQPRPEPPRPAQAPWMPPTNKWMPPALWLPSPAVAKAMVPPLSVGEPSSCTREAPSTEAFAEFSSCTPPKLNNPLQSQAGSTSGAHPAHTSPDSLESRCLQAHTQPQNVTNSNVAQTPASTYSAQTSTSTYPTQVLSSTYPVQTPSSTHSAQTQSRATFFTAQTNAAPVHYPPPAGYPQLPTVCPPAYPPQVPAQPTFYPMQPLYPPQTAFPSHPNTAQSLARLRDMGFVDDARNLYVLQQCNYDLGPAISRLLH